MLTVMLLSSIATWLFVGKLPDVYKSKAVLSTGIIEYKGPNLQKDNPFIQKFQIESSFSGLIEKMKSRKSMKKLTDKLLLHDLSEEGGKSRPFRVPEGDEIAMTQTELDTFVQKLKTNYKDSLLNEKPQLATALDNRLAKIYGYDHETLLKKLDIKRVGETDYLTVEYESESPELSYFVVRTFVDEFMKLHEKDLSEQEDLALDFQTKQVTSRKLALDSMVEAINNYKDQNKLVDIEFQRESVISHMKELELKLEEKRQMIPALRGQINILNSEIIKYNKELKGYLSGNIYFSADFERLNNEIKKLNDQYVEYVAAGKDATAIGKRVDKLKLEQAQYIERQASSVTSKSKDKIDEQVRGWIKESLEKQLELKLAEAAVPSYESEISKLRQRADKLLTNDNSLATLIAEKERIEKEYLSARAEYDQAKLFAAGTENPLDVVEAAQYPDEPESKHRTIFSVFAGVASGTIASILLFFLAFIDSSLQSPGQFQRTLKLPLLGYVNRIRVKNRNLKQLFEQTQPVKDLEIFKENIRKLRTALEGAGAKSFLFVSPKEQEGKSFLIMLLAYALSLNEKRILIIDTNFKNNTLSDFKTKSYIEITTDGAGGPKSAAGASQKMLQAVAGEEDDHLKNIDIVGNKGGSQSPSEVLAGKDFKKVLEVYAKKYDFIFLEAAAMNKFSDARELLPFVDKVVAVVSAESPIGNADKDTMDFLRGMNGKMLGGILNNVDLKNI